MDLNNLEWQFTPSTNQLNAPKEVKHEYEPRYRPLNLFVSVDSAVHEMEPVEYFISYSNGSTCIGMAKQQSLAQNQPFTMQFGSWKKPLKNRELYIGCTVLVKSYYKIVKKSQNGTKAQVKQIIKAGANHYDLFYKGRLFANTVACDWAITHKPKLNPTLGTVLDFWCDKDQNQRLFFNAIIYDQDSGEELTISDDHWPSYVKQQVQKDTPLVLNWIEIKEPYAIYYGFQNFPTILPIRNDYNLRNSEEEVAHGSVLGWVDTRYWGSD